MRPSCSLFESCFASISDRFLCWFTPGGSISAGQIAEILDGAGTCEVHLSTRKPTATAYRGLTGGAIASAKNNGVTLHTELSELKADGSITFKDGSVSSYP